MPLCGSSRQELQSVSLFLKAGLIVDLALYTENGMNYSLLVSSPELKRPFRISLYCFKLRHHHENKLSFETSRDQQAGWRRTSHPAAPRGCLATLQALSSLFLLPPPPFHFSYLYLNLCPRPGFP